MFAINEFYIKVRLEEKGISQEELAKRVGSNEASISLLIRNKQKKLDLELAYKICKELNIPINELVIDTSKQKEPTEEEIFDQMYFTLDKLYKTFTYYKIKKDSGYNKYVKEMLNQIKDYTNNDQQKIENAIKEISDNINNLSKEGYCNSDESNELIEKLTSFNATRYKIKLKNNKPATKIFNMSTENRNRKKNK